MARQPCEPRLPFGWGFDITLTPHSVGLLWTSDGPVTKTSTWKDPTLKRERDFYAPGGIRTRNLSKLAASDPRLRLSGRSVLVMLCSLPFAKIIYLVSLCLSVCISFWINSFPALVCLFIVFEKHLNPLSSSDYIRTSIFNTKKTFHFARRVHSCFLCDSYNKQRLFP